MLNHFCISVSLLATLTFPVTALTQPSLPMVSFTRSSYVVSENAGDSKVLTLIRNNGDISKPSTVTLLITGGTASVDDYEANGIELKIDFKPGESIKTITVPIKNDKELEEKESIDFAIATVDGARLGSQTTASLEISDVDTTQLPNAIRFAVVNGVIEYVNNAQQATIALEWDLLPLEGNKQLIRLMREYYPVSKPISCSIRNEDLGTKKWTENLSSDCLSYLTDAFKVRNLNELNKQLGLEKIAAQGEDFTLASSENNSQKTEFEKFWTLDKGKGYTIATTSGLSASQYYGTLRDYLQMKLLLSSSGITYSFDVSGEPKPQGEFPRISDKNINWEIKIYRFPVAKNIFLYRYTAKAVVDHFKLVFPVSNLAESPKNPPKADISINFKKSEATVGLLEPDITAVPLPIELSPVVKEKIDNLKETNSDQELITTLGYFFNLKNAELGKFVSNNFLGGLQNSSIITGGLISDKSVDSLVGIDTKLTDIGDVKLGATIGIGVNNSNPLFVGPSISYSGLTIAAGARISSKNDTLKFDPSGLISLDLSQALGGQQQNKKVTIDKSQVGGDWGVASDLISQNLALVYWSISTSGTLVNNKDCNNVNILPENQAKIPLTFLGNSKLGFIPRGKYEYQNLQGKTENIDVCKAEGVNRF
jgi:Calx-beta domain